MQLTEKTKSFIQLHVSIILFGFSALFGKFINQPPCVIVFGRVLLSAITLFLIIKLFKLNEKIPNKKDTFWLFGIGLIFAIHWITFFKSIQVSNVAIGILSFSTFPIFVTFLEPCITKEKIKLFDIATAFMTFIGVAIIIPRFDLSDNIAQGVIWGVIAGATCAVLILGNRSFIKKYSSTTITLYENVACALFLLPLVIINRPVLSEKDFIYILILGIILTASAQILYISSIKNIKAQLASVSTALEPVYGIFLASMFLGEEPTLRTLIGGAIILISIIVATLKTRD